MNPILPYVVTFVLNLVIAFVLAQVCVWRDANTAGRGAAIGVLLWLGIVGPITLTTAMYEGRPMALYAINEFYPLVGLCVMGAILGAWTKGVKTGTNCAGCVKNWRRASAAADRAPASAT